MSALWCIMWELALLPLPRNRILLFLQAIQGSSKDSQEILEASLFLRTVSLSNLDELSLEIQNFRKEDVSRHKTIWTQHDYKSYFLGKQSYKHFSKSFSRVKPKYKFTFEVTSFLQKCSQNVVGCRSKYSKLFSFFFFLFLFFRSGPFLSVNNFSLFFQNIKRQRNVLPISNPTADLLVSLVWCDLASASGNSVQLSAPVDGRWYVFCVVHFRDKNGFWTLCWFVSTDGNELFSM